MSEAPEDHQDISLPASPRNDLKHRPRPPIDRSRYRNPDEDPRGPWLASDLTMPGVRPPLIYELEGHFPPDGRSWRFAQDRMTQLNAEGRLMLQAGRRPHLKRYLADIVEDEPLPEEDPTSPVAAIVRSFSRALALALARAPGALADMEWRDLERALAEVCEGLGFRTTLTRPAKDGGFDLEVEADGARYLIEVKHWSAPALVGAEVVSQFAEVVVSQAAAKGLLLSSSGFRPAVLAERLEITPSSVALGDGRKIIGLCQRYARRSALVWWPETDLAEILFEETL